MRKGKTPTSVDGPLVSEEHRALFAKFKDRVQRLPAVRRVLGQSVQGALVICLVIDTDDERVWDKVADIEYDITRQAPELAIVFRECDLKSQTIAEFKVDLPLELAQSLVA